MHFRTGPLNFCLPMGCQYVASGCAKSFFLQFCFVGARYRALLFAALPFLAVLFIASHPNAPARSSNLPCRARLAFIPTPVGEAPGRLGSNVSHSKHCPIRPDLSRSRCGSELQRQVLEVSIYIVNNREYRGCQQSPSVAKDLQQG